MPIERDEFESGKVLNKLEKAIIAFLQKNHDKAFTSSEIMEGINFQTDFSDVLRAMISGVALLLFPNVLNNLVASGKIRVNIVQGLYYYMAK
jgi:hypothetical protein